MAVQQIKNTEAMEVTTFRLTKGTCGDFIAANKDIDEFLKRQPGFRSRRIAEIEKGLLMDMLLWDKEENGVQAMHRLMDEMKDSPVHALIDQQTVSWNIATVEHHLD